jgi:hypothetical protein
MTQPRLDSDLFIFLLAVVNILVNSLSQLRRNQPFIPADYAFEEVPVQALNEIQREFFGGFDKQLLDMNYRPVCTYRVANYGSNLFRMYINPADRASCKVMIVETKVNVNGVRTANNSSLVAFRTEFANGKGLTTRNMHLRTVLDHPPEYVVQERPNVHDLPTLKADHDAAAAELGLPLPPPASADRIFELYQKEHRRFSEFQVERGTYVRAAGGYRVGDKALWRGVRNFLVPFAERFSLPRLALAALCAVGLPSVTYLRLLPMVMLNAEQAGFDPHLAWALTLGARYALAGLAVGLLLELNEFIWAFLFTFVGVHLVTGWWSSSIPFGAIAAVVSHAASRFRKQRGLVLRTA